MPVVLSYIQARQILERVGSTSCRVSLDLGLTTTEIELDPGGAILPDGTRIDFPTLKKLVKKDKKCIVNFEGEWRDIRIMSETTGWVRSLCPTSGAPTTLVSGFPMHRIKDTDPWQDSKTKIAALGSVHGRALDTTTGLGYTAILLAECADSVVTVELDPTAIEIARFNPWSERLFTNEKIDQRIGDIGEVIESFDDRSFSVIVHDPPTIQYAGELYSLEFYVQLRRVLSFKGRLFHYIADPDSNQGKKLTDGVMKRLKEAGFHTVKRHPEAFGVVAS